ncbi:hypothetical protein [Lacrimispora amygdalina]|uniref:hypothetical protein n=1 Tax=Lacrimispora amygdalina TaxID=253257 RepID=UPI000BE30494|nr:hypothetical protein [Lacrimispora amygdalina]
MGMLDIFLIAGLTANIMKSESSKDNNSILNEKSIILSSEKSRIGRLRLSNIRRENFESDDRNILQITKQKVGLDTKYPLHIIEYLIDDNVDGVIIQPNYNCYQKQFIESKFCLLSFDEIGDFKNYKVLKIHTEPIEITGYDEKMYLCEVVKILQD